MADVFISWSGAKSKACAEALRDWLPMMLQSVKPFLSSEDIRKGARGSQVLAAQLEKCSIGIVCLTQENIHKDWILFEAGALSKQVDEAALYTLLLDLQPSDLKSPLADFQATLPLKEDFFALVSGLNERQTAKLDEKRLEGLFERLWPGLEGDLKKAQSAAQPASPKLTERELLEEILASVRSLARTTTTPSQLAPAIVQISAQDDAHDHRSWFESANQSWSLNAALNNTDPSWAARELRKSGHKVVQRVLNGRNVYLMDEIVMTPAELVKFYHDDLKSKVFGGTEIKRRGPQ